MINKNRLKATSLLLGLLFSMPGNSEPNKQQLAMIREPANMIDLFIERSERDLIASIGNVIELYPPDIEFRQKKKNNNRLSVRGFVVLNLDWNRGKWVIGFNSVYRASHNNKSSYPNIYRDIVPTLSNARKICKSLIFNMQVGILDLSHANHRGFERAGYLENASIDDFNNSIIYKASFTISNKVKEKSLVVTCEKGMMQNDENITYAISGPWK